MLLGRSHQPPLIVVCLLALSLSSACRRSSANEAASRPPPPGALVVAESIYEGGLANGWQDWGWGAHELKSGPARVNMSSYGGIIFHHDPLSGPYGGVSFRFKAPKSFGHFLGVSVGDKKQGLPDVPVGPDHTRPGPGGTTNVWIPWSLLNPSGVPVDQIMIHARASVGGDWVELDKVALTRPVAVPPGPPRDVTLTVECKAQSRPISRFIYGLAGYEIPWELKATAHRWGGNPTTRYNWTNGFYNVGKDWFFENAKGGNYRAFVDDNVAHGALTALTVPTIGWVAKDGTSVGFPVSKLGAQRATDQYRKDAGDGARADGSLVTPGPPTETSVAAPPELMKQWVETIRRDDAKSGKRSVEMYILDNEPGLWHDTHRDVHPAPVSYDEYLDRTIRYAEAIRSADPGGLIAGPAAWGWSEYFHSAKDLGVGTTLRPDRRAHGDLPLLAWYLKSVREYEQKVGHKILDVLDVHFYPQGQGVYGSAADENTAALRLRSTRALWDKTYVDESWIKEAVNLVPRLKDWVATYAPGLPISIGEYNFGGEQHMSGALALAEALGRFGTLGVTYAFYWTAPPKDSPAAWAFKAYRDFDGKGAHFLDRSLPAQSPDGVSLFASVDETGKHLVLIALNLDPKSPAKAKLVLDGCGPLATAQKYSYAAGSKALTADANQTSPSPDVALAPYSLNVFDITLK